MQANMAKVRGLYTFRMIFVKQVRLSNAYILNQYYKAGFYALSPVALQELWGQFSGPHFTNTKFIPRMCRTLPDIKAQL